MSFLCICFSSFDHSSHELGSVDGHLGLVLAAHVDVCSRHLALTLDVVLNELITLSLVVRVREQDAACDVLLRSSLFALGHDLSNLVLGGLGDLDGQDQTVDVCNTHGVDQDRLSDLWVGRADAHLADVLDLFFSFSHELEQLVQLLGDVRWFFARLCSISEHSEGEILHLVCLEGFDLLIAPRAVLERPVVTMLCEGRGLIDLLDASEEMVVLDLDSLKGSVLPIDEHLGLRIENHAQGLLVAEHGQDGALRVSPSLHGCSIGLVHLELDRLLVELQSV